MLSSRTYIAGLLLTWLQLEKPRFITRRRRLNQLWYLQQSNALCYYKWWCLDQDGLMEKGGDGLSVKTSHELVRTAWLKTIYRKFHTSCYICKKALWSVWKHSQELDPGYLWEERVQMTIIFFFVFSGMVHFFFMMTIIIVQKQFGYFSRRKARFLSLDSTLRLVTFLVFPWRCAKAWGVNRALNIAFLVSTFELLV